MRFTYRDTLARSVTLVGDFNAWARGATPLVRDSVTGVWSIALPLSPGRHQYAFVVDERRWVVDPMAPRSSVDSLGRSATLIVAAPDGPR